MQDAKPVHHDAIQRIIGSFGRYQLRLCLSIIVSKYFLAQQQMAIIFLAPRVSYICPDTNAETCPCSDPIYNRSVFENTIISEWDLICERRWMVGCTQMIFQSGSLVGSIVFGMASDRYGRKWPMLFVVSVQVVAGILVGFIPEFWTFNFIRFIVGMSVGGVMVTSFVIIMEFVGSQYRGVMTALYQVPFNLGHISLPLIAYVFRDYVHFQIAISAPALVMILYFFIVPETPRWLIAMKRTDEAIDIIEYVAKTNNRPTANIRSEIESYQGEMEKHHLKKGHLFDLFKTPNLRRNILIMSYNWLSCSYCFYGVSQYVGELGGNIFVNVAASATVALGGTLFSIPLMKIIGRRAIIIMFNFICAFCLLIQAIIPEGVGSVVCACIGVVASFVVFVVVYLYCTELFPTVVRSAALGFSSMMARVGSMVAPFVIDLNEYKTWAPPLLFGILPLTAAFLTYLLPETKGCELTNTLEEGESSGTKKSKRAERAMML